MATVTPAGRHGPEVERLVGARPEPDDDGARRVSPHQRHELRPVPQDERGRDQRDGGDEHAVRADREDGHRRVVAENFEGEAAGAPEDSGEAYEEQPDSSG